MSMSILSALQLTGIAAAYFIVTLLLPWLFLRKWLAGFGSVSERFMIYFLAGNFYIINLVYLLQLLHISCWLTLFFGTFAPFITVAFVKYRSSFRLLIENWLARYLLFLGGETGRKTVFLRMKRKLRRCLADVGKKNREYIEIFGVEILLVAGLVGLLLYMYGANALNFYGYGASDVVVHNYWINEMRNNHIFINGVYPFGMHCLLYYLHELFRIPVYVLLRLFYVVQTMMIHLMLLAFVRSVCRSKYAPYIGIVIYIITDRWYQYTFVRYYATLPQEMGMEFILPAVYFAMAFLREKSPALGILASDDEEIQKVGEGKKAVTVSGLYLILFAISVSLTVSVHFYDTIVTGLFCIAVGAGFCFRVFHQSYFKRIVASGIVGLLIGVLPMGIAFVTGTPLEPSLRWGMTQFSPSSSTANTKGKRTVLEIVLDRMEYYTVNDMQTAQAIVASIAVLFVLGILMFLLRRAEYGAVLVSVSVFVSILAVLQAAPELGLIQLLETSRYSIYLGYGVAAVWSLIVDAALFSLFKKGIILDYCSFAVLVIACIVTVKSGVREHLYDNSAWEPNEAIICLNNIIRENKEGTWTICSANDERQMIAQYPLGSHYEMITFLREMHPIKEDTSITIPASTVYFFIEKSPILYQAALGDGMVSQEGAERPLSEEGGIFPYMEEERWITMSHMYYWARAFQELYPNEMEVYYETKNFVCYRIKQNEYSLYNFAIDYGYN